MKSRVFIVEDHPIYREGLALYINKQPDMFICGETDNAADAMTKIEELTPHLVIIDLKLFNSSGFSLVQNIRSRWPKLKILILTMYEETRFARRLIQEGASGYIMKDEGPKVVLQALRSILAGQTYASEKIKQQFLSRGVKASPEDALTNRELEILQLVGEGKSVAEIAQILDRSSKTIQNHILRIKEKLWIPSRQAFYQLARDRVTSDDMQ